MTDTAQHQETVTEDSSGNEIKRTRYTGPVELIQLDETEVDISTTGLGRGRPQMDYKPYEDALKKNYAKNMHKDRKESNNKVALVYQVNSDAVSTVKSRFNTAAQNIGCGLTYDVTENQDGTTTIKIVAGKRLEGRGRRGSTDKGNGSDKQTSASTS